MSEKQVLHDLNLNLNEIKKVSKITDENDDDILEKIQSAQFLQGA
jgi:hypothetical protein